MNAVRGPGFRGGRFIAAAAVLLILAACEAPTPPVENHPQWVIHSNVSFVEPDLATPREALPLSAFRLSFSYVAGHLEGKPSIGDFLHPQINPDYSFVIDLNHSQGDLVRSLQPTDFSGEPNLRIDPEDARIARLLPQALRPESDSIEQVATTQWVDARSHAPLMLVYFDRPARITGTAMRDGLPNRYNIRAGDAGYVWIGCTLNNEGEIMFREVETPQHVILALSPKTTGGSCQGLPAQPPAAQTSETPGAAVAARAETTASTPLDLRGGESPRQAAARERGAPER